MGRHLNGSSALTVCLPLSSLLSRSHVTLEIQHRCTSRGGSVFLLQSQSRLTLRKRQRSRLVRPSRWDDEHETIPSRRDLWSDDSGRGSSYRYPVSFHSLWWVRLQVR